jgi:hypothetical protein
VSPDPNNGEHSGSLAAPRNSSEMAPNLANPLLISPEDMSWITLGSCTLLLRQVVRPLSQANARPYGNEA